MTQPTASAQHDASREDLAAAIRRQSLRIRTLQSTEAFKLLFVATVGQLVVFQPMGLLAPALAWLLPVNVAAYATRRFALGVLARIDASSSPEVHRMLNRMLLVAGANATLVGSGVWWLGSAGAAAPALFLATFVQVLYTLGAMINTSTHLPTFATSVSITTGSSIVFWIVQGDVGYAIALALVGLGLLMVRFARRLKADFEDVVKIRFENAELVRRLEAEKLVSERARDEAQAANVAKSRFLAAASHDLRQPLHALILFSSLLDSAPANERDALVGHVRQTAQSLDKLFGGLLDLSRLDSGAISVNPATIPLRPLLAGLVDEVRPHAEQKGLAVAAELGDAWSRTDPFLLERIVRNLLDNAVKYTASGTVGLRVTSDGSDVDVTVWDTGPGIGEDEIHRIFDEFYQVENPARTTERGTGLGLAIVRRLGELLGHRVTARSRLGEGSAFTVTLPAAAEVGPGHERRAAVAGQRSLAGMRVWVVDDDRRVQAAMQQLLCAWQAEPSIFATVDEATRAIDEADRPPDALVVDFRLPGNGTGAQYIERVRQRFAGLPAAIVTGEPDTRLPGMEALDDVPVFQKPVAAQDIRAWLEMIRHELSGAPDDGR